MLVLRSYTCRVLLYKRVSRLGSVHCEGGLTFEQRRYYETNEYQTAKQTQHKNNRFERNENHHSNLRGTESSWRLTSILLRKTNAALVR